MYVLNEMIKRQIVQLDEKFSQRKTVIGKSAIKMELLNYWVDFFPSSIAFSFSFIRPLRMLNRFRMFYLI